MENNILDINKMDLPNDLKGLSYNQLRVLSSQIREVLIKGVSKTGGHLASNLGTVELSLAIHKVFDSPEDKIVWDVGHQAYTHKILTGRLGRFETLRQENGLSGFPKTSESVHDAFISGHSSTSISAALGIATAMKMKGKDNFTIAVIGDGAFTGGLAYEGLNNAGKSDANFIVILNHNEMSISKNVGGLAKYLTTLRTTQSYQKTKSIVEKALDYTPLIGKPIKAVIKSSKSALKDFLLHSTMFEEFGFEFIGPVDGHNIKEICEALNNAKAMNKPVFVHVNTIKGKGYTPAENNPGQFHGIGKFDIESGNPDISDNETYSSEFGKELSSLADKDERICAITAAMKYGTGLQHFTKSHRNRFFDVGIAEQHAVTFSAGLSKMGYLPVFCVYSSFLQRAYDQVLHDVSIENTHMVLGIDRAGIVGEDGETHQGLFDVPFLTTIPNLTLYSPLGYKEMNLCLNKGLYEDNGIVGIRYPRGSEPDDVASYDISTDFSYSGEKGEILLITYGRISSNVHKAKKNLNEKGINCDILRLIKIFPYNNEIVDIAQQYDYVVFFEESMQNGSISQKLGSVLSNDFVGRYYSKAINSFVQHASTYSALKNVGLDSESMINMVLQVIKNGNKA